MAIRTPQQYIESIRDDRVVYYEGKKVKDITKHDYIKMCIDWMAIDYVLENDPKFKDLMLTKDADGEDVPFILSAQKSREDLMRLREVVKLLARVSYGKPSGAKFVGKDGLNAVTVVSQRIDKKYGTSYARNVDNFRRHLQKNDLTLALAMTDVKGDRSLHPSKQKQHKDFYVRIVEEKKDGIVVRGAKTHISQSPCSNEMIVVPCRAMREDDKDYAVSFGIPANTKGITFISTEAEAREPGNFFDYPISASVFINDATIIFDDVFVPNERIFMKKEWPLAGDIAYMFGNFHRLSAETYKAAELEVLTGAALLMAEYNGIEKASHVVDKLTWLIQYTEAVEILGRAACEHCITESDSDLVYPNPMIANICKLYFADNWHQATKYIQDIAGGIVATVPSAKDYFNPETHDLMEKYFGGKDGIPTEHRLRAVKLVKDLTSSYEDVLTIHAEGSLAAQKLSIFAGADFERYKAAAKRAARINDGTQHEIYSQLPEFPSKSY
ncbi:MAG TPA: 4-hydroxyphenylacetate 3-hydroxylase N-terminal domain-containing protein [Dehalococcoidia bacterium]|nr:4-hydroxyphenylacetate 3-hydroxylase N-terminal domain-containing protein [Dehalococcoidia bacterium]